MSGRRWLRIRLPFTAAALTVLLAAAAAAVPGGLDRSFGGDGIASASFTPGVDFAADLAIQEDGKFVLAGAAGLDSADAKFAIARFRTDGTRDPSFGGDGRVTVNVSRGLDVAFSVAIDSEGRIVVGGNAGFDGRNTRFGLVRLLPNGSVDASFSGGAVVTNFTRGIDGIGSVLVDASGRIVAAGIAGIRNSGADSRFAVARYRSNGTLDPSFGDDGRVTTNFTAGQDGAAEVDLDPVDSSLLVAGTAAGAGDARFALARYTDVGTLDASFGGDGRVVSNPTGLDDFLNDMVLQADRKIVVAGSAGTRFAAARYDPGGTLDDSFSDDGIVQTNVSRWGDAGMGVALQPVDGSVVVGGIVGTDRRDSATGLVRYTATGALDHNFGDDGRVVTNRTPSDEGARAVAIQDDGRIVLAGFIGTHGVDFAAYRYLAS